MKNFSDHEFKPSDIIEGLNEFYRKVGERRRFEAKYGLSGAAGPFLIIKRRCGDLKTSFYDSHAVEEAITWLREECDIFYTPGMNWEDLKYKMPLKAYEKEYGTADIREMYPKCLVKPRTSKIGWTDEEKEALEALRTLYYDVATCHERALKRLTDYDVDWPETSYMVEYIRKRFKTAEENVEYLCKEDKKIDSYEATLSEIADIMEPEYAGPTWSETWDDLVGRIRCMKEDNDTLRKRLETADSNVTYFAKMKDDLQKQVNTLKDLINQIHEDSDI